ncbi:MAG: LPS export ABC transporter permease LptF [Proteobacteria bacterium]|nr:LPS export ABC transporter permease LptF [Pseudomonadota bacterium]
MIFRRALLRELTANAIYVFVVLVAILLTQFLIKLIGAASSGSLPSDGLIPLVGFRLISQLPPLIVIAMFVAILLTLSRAWRDSEMAIWMSCGQSLLAWVRPVLTFALPMLIIAMVLSTALSPWAERRSIEYRRVLEARDELSVLAPGLFQELRKTRQVYFVESVNLIEGVIKNVFVFADDPHGAWTVRARQGFLLPDTRGDRYVILEDGNRVRQLNADPATREYELASFERYGIRMTGNEVTDTSFEERAKDTLTLLREGSPSGLGQVFYRVSVPLAGLALALLAIPLAYVNPRLGRSVNLIIAILLLMISLNVMNIMQAQIDREKIGWISALVIFHLSLAALVAAVFYYRFRGAVAFHRGDAAADPPPAAAP